MCSALDYTSQDPSMPVVLLASWLVTSLHLEIRAEVGEGGKGPRVDFHMLRLPGNVRLILFNGSIHLVVLLKVTRFSRQHMYVHVGYGLSCSWAILSLPQAPTQCSNPLRAIKFVESRVASCCTSTLQGHSWLAWAAKTARHQSTNNYTTFRSTT